MNNDPELSGKYLGTISADFAIVSETLKEASYQIRSRDFSECPIFAISKGELPMGPVLIAKEELATTWNYYASYLELFVEQNLVQPEKVEEFKAVYKDPDEFCCLFVVDGKFTNFLFIPYPVD